MCDQASPTNLMRSFTKWRRVIPDITRMTCCCTLPRLSTSISLKSSSFLTSSMMLSHVTTRNLTSSMKIFRQVQLLQKSQNESFNTDSTPARYSSTTSSYDKIKKHKNSHFLIVTLLQENYAGYILTLKYYLNEQIIIKPYDEEIKLRHPTFFAIFNTWAKKYGNSVLATTPRKINAYYFELAAQLEVDENTAATNNQENCQYRNYNQIVEQLIKATTQVEDAPEYDREPPEE